MDTYTEAYIDEAMKAFTFSNLDPKKKDQVKQLLKIDIPESQKLSLKTNGDFSKASLKDTVRLIGILQGDPNGEETIELRDKLARQLLLKVDVEFFLDGEKVGQLTKLTDVGQSLEADAFLQDNWLFYQLVLDVTTGYVLKNFTAPPKLIPKAAGAGTGVEPRG